MKMYSYIVAYDLCKPDRDYQSLYEMLPLSLIGVKLPNLCGV